MTASDDDLHEGGRRRQWRAALLTRRLAMTPAERAAHDEAIDRSLAALLPLLPPRVRTLGLCWPHRREYDARSFAARFVAGGRQAALPVVQGPDAALVFCRWQPDDEMVAGAHGIPVPAHCEPVRPDLLLVPMVGFDEAGYRLGYGGGYFDRTLARQPGCVAVGIGYEFARLPTIGPAAHDVPMAAIVTEAGWFERRDGRLQRCDPQAVAALLA